MQEVICVTAYVASGHVKMKYTDGVLTGLTDPDFEALIADPHTGYAVGRVVPEQLERSPLVRGPKTEGIGPVNDSINPWVGRASLWVKPENKWQAEQRVREVLRGRLCVYRDRLDRLIKEAE